MSKHTPGPWVWIEPQKVLNSAHGTVIDYAAYEGMWFAAYDSTTDEANARLIAAAPDLLAALTEAMATAEFERHPFRGWHLAAREAIDKATGADA